MKIATGITIFISCMGLFGLTLFSAEKRTREIGIRKVLGATVFDIMVLMSRDFLMPVLLAFIIAAPIAWYYVHYWLSDFVYRIQVSWWLFVLSGFTAITIALITVSYLALKAALANPVKALRIE
jgi:putative ABC transport system permease protein